MSKYGVRRDPGHTPTINAIGWGEPPTYIVYCSCGWQGITVETPYGKTEEECLAALIEPLQELLKDEGSIYSSGPNSVYGNADTALIQVLHHLNYSPRFDVNSAQSEVDKLFSGFKDEHKLPKKRLLGKALNTAVEELVDAHERAEVWKSVPMPTLPPPKPEVWAKVRAITNPESASGE